MSLRSETVQHLKKASPKSWWRFSLFFPFKIPHEGFVYLKPNPTFSRWRTLFLYCPKKNPLANVFPFFSGYV